MFDAIRSRLFAARRFRYEIQVLRDGRWQIVAALDDGRTKPDDPFDQAAFEAMEARVRQLARQYLAEADTRAVKVMRERMRRDGSSTTSEFLQLHAPPDKDRPIVVHRPAAIAASCSQPDDLLTRPASATIGTVLRVLLDRLETTPLELLCDERWHRVLDGQAAVIWSAILTVAEQDDPMRIGRKKRAVELEALVKAMRTRQQAAAARPDAPALTGHDLVGLIAAQPSGGDAQFLLYRAIARAMRESRGWLGRIELLLAMAGEVAPASALESERDRIVDLFLAGVLDAPGAIKDLLPFSSELGQALVDLAHISAGKAPERPIDESSGLARLIAQGRLPETRFCLTTRIVRSLSSGQELARGGEREEWRALDRLEQALPADQAEMFAAGLNRRRQMVRNAMLETPPGPSINATARALLSRH